MRKSEYLLGLALPLLTFLAVDASAEIMIFDNGVGGEQGINDAQISDLDFFDSFIVTDDALVNQTAAVTRIEWTGRHTQSNSISDDFSISLFTGTTASPNSEAAVATYNVGDSVNRADSGVDLFGTDVFKYSAELNFEMNANQTYWVSIYNNNSGPLTMWWAWGMVSRSGNSFSSTSIGSSWTAENYQQDFRLFGTFVEVPEPASILHLSTGIYLFTIWRRRNR